MSKIMLLIFFVAVIAPIFFSTDKVKLVDNSSRDEAGSSVRKGGVAHVLSNQDNMFKMTTSQ